MPKYRVMIDGRHFLVAFDCPRPAKGECYQVEVMPLSKGNSTKLVWVGFMTNVYVTAATPHDAELAAVEVLRKDPKLKDITRNPANLPPRLHAEEIEEIKNFRGCLRPRAGLAFYQSRKPKGG